MIYNGECIFANGIELAMTLEEIPIPQRSLITRKIIAYYNKVTENNNAKLKGSK